MAWKQIREPKLPAADDVAKGSDYWLAKEQIARERLRQADNSRARQRQMERITFCQIAASQAST